MTTADIVLAIVAGLVVNECCDLSPWVARKLVRWSARLRYSDPARARLRADELVALIEERPGKLLKLFTALGFISSALALRTCHATARRLTRAGSALQRLGQRLTSRYSRAWRAASSVMAPEELLARADFARGVAATLRSLDASKGTVVAVRGPWGSGKTSLVNLVAQDLRASPGPLVVQLNPWLLGNDHQSAAFFADLASKLRPQSAQLTRVADSLRRYGDGLAGTAAPASVPARLGAPSGTIGRLRRHRLRLRRALRKLPQPLVVVIDDIDRLPPEEARRVFRLVRRTARLPQLIYVMVFDRAVAEPLLAQERAADGAPRRRLREIAYDLPRTVRRHPPSGPDGPAGPGPPPGRRR